MLRAQLTKKSFKNRPFNFHNLLSQTFHIKSNPKQTKTRRGEGFVRNHYDKRQNENEWNHAAWNKTMRHNYAVGKSGYYFPLLAIIQLVLPLATGNEWIKNAPTRFSLSSMLCEARKYVLEAR
jgi:hypothetical protein